MKTTSPRMNDNFITRNTVYNLVGNILPLCIAFFTIPILIKGLGTDRYGVLNLAWLIIGYFGLFDLGLGRALTQIVAEKLGNKHEEEIPGVVWTGMLLLLGLGVIGAGIGIVASSWLVKHFLKIPPELQYETQISFILLFLTIPIILSTAALRGILEALQRFDLINAIRIPMGIFQYLGPLIALAFSSNLVVVISVLTVGRLIAWVTHLFMCFHCLPDLRNRILIVKTSIKPMLRFGGWLTVSSIVGPLMVYLDRFLIGAFVSVTAVAYYATPYQLITQLTIISAAISGVLFPVFAMNFAQNRHRAIVLFERSIRYIFIILFPAIIIINFFAFDGLKLWLGNEFALHSYRVMQLLAIGVLVNSIASIPFTFVQGIGQPQVTAKLHLIELPLYLLALWFFLKSFGIEGAAVVWTARAAIDMVVLLIIVNKYIHAEAYLIKRSILIITSGTIFLLITFLPFKLETRIIFAFFILLIYTLLTWFVFLQHNERDQFLGWLKVSRLVIKKGYDPKSNG
jgi:O-antigen/teichoic acid export membrane protein